MSQFLTNLKTKYLLTEEEINSVTIYTSHGAKSINNKILRNELSNDDDDFLSHLSQALKKLPGISLEIIYRHLNLYGAIPNALAFFNSNLGKAIRFSTLLSCSRRDVFAGNEEYYDFVIKITSSSVSTGRDIEKIRRESSLNNPEQEILYDRDTCFSVIKISNAPYIKVHLEECEFNPMAIPVPYFQ